MSQRIKEAIVATADFYSAQMSEAKLMMFYEDLCDLDENAVCTAYRNYRRNPANRQNPLPAQIRELVAPGEFIAPEALARETAARIIGAISQFGWNNGREAQVYIGPEGWNAVLRQGGWSHLCEQTSKFNELTLQAQLRDQLIGVFKYGSSAIEQALGVASKPRAGELTQGFEFKRLTPAPGDDQEGA